MCKATLDFNEEEISWIQRLKEFHSTNSTPNHRHDEKSAIEIAIAGIDKLGEISLKETV